jgi:UDP-N-acetylmuramyl pentapeptide phosphotransferase/UDP-N-acetylglucosamine-1-phosphate transferase
VVGCLIGPLAVALVGVIDDLSGIRPGTKFIGQIVAVAMTLAVGHTLGSFRSDLTWLILAGLWIVAFTNVFNFMDGSDGLAAGCATLFAICLGAIEATHGGSTDPLLYMLLACVTIGFLGANFPPASIFMGDSGSLFLGMLIAVLAAESVAAGTDPIAVLLAVWPFVFDSSWTLARRIWRGESFWEAHRSHLYQRLLLVGHSHRFVAVVYYCWVALSGMLGFIYQRAEINQRILMISIAVASAAVVVFSLRKSERQCLARSHSATALS